VVLSPVCWARSLVTVDPEAVESEMNGLAVGVRGDKLPGRRLGIRLYRLEDLVGVPVSGSWKSAPFLLSWEYHSPPHRQKPW
jgi:hypothetical protein